MSEFYGEGVSRTLSAKARQFVNVVWQKGKPPLDSELNLMTQLVNEARQAMLAANVSSGFIGNVVGGKEDYQFNRQASNLLWLGKNEADSEGDVIWANVNGWLVPVVGTQSTDTRNAILLPPPAGSASDSDVNFVFLEVWQAQVSPDGTDNKPAANFLYKYGNVEYGGTNVTNDLQDPAIAAETTERVQLQYRLRVVSGVNPALNPNGFNSAVKGQGTLDNPTTNTSPNFRFTNMKDELGDPGLWRAGDGNGETGVLGTVDGYTYAVPVALVFRRSTLTWTRTQQHGALNRNPDMTDRSEASVLPTIGLAADINATTTTVEVDVSQASTTFDSAGGLVRVNGEIMAYSSYSGTTFTISARGARGTHATAHSTGDPVDFVSGHPLGLFSDQIVDDDVLDLRHMISMDGLDYNGILRTNFDQLVKGQLGTTWKKSSGSVKGTRHYQLDYFGASAVAPDFSAKADQPDGFRKIFSDACTLQPNNLVVLGTNGATEATADLSFNPGTVIHRQSTTDWNDNDVALFSLDQFRSTFSISAPNNKKVRFVHPYEYDGSPHSPVRLWFGDTDPSGATPGKTAPLTLESTDANPWFMVLGSVVEDLSVASEGQADIDFSTSGGNGVLDVSGVTFSAQDGTDLVTAGAWVLLTPGTDDTSTNPENHGAFRVNGVDGSGNLLVEDADGTVPAFTTTTNNRSYSLRLTSCAEDDENLAVILLRGDADPIASATTLLITYDLLYHPARGLSRVPEDALYVELDPGADANFVRENDFQNVEDAATATVKKSPAVSMMAYPHKGVSELQTRGSQDVASSVETVWAEAYVDRGSKTLVYQPLRNISARLELQNNPGAITITDNSSLWNLATSDTEASVLIPKELRPTLGRIDLPFVTSKASVADDSTAPAYGLNCTLLSGSPDVNSGYLQQRIVAVYDPVNTTISNFGDYTDLSGIGGGPGGTSALVCRYYDQGGVRGIELPANYGVARLFAAHLQSDFYTVSPGQSVFSSGSNYRVASGVARQNILRTDGERRSLIITDNNTFVIPEDVLDQNYFTDELADQPLIFEFAAFLFDDWTQDLMRVHELAAAGATTNDFQLFVNGPSLAGDDFFLVSTRRPYQGSIYGTMPIARSDTASVEYSDYDPKRNTESQADILDLFTPLSPEEDVRVSNPGTLEVLAALPFATTLGTGVVSGPVEPGSYTDTGYLNISGFPFTDLTDADRSAVSRAHPFTNSGAIVSPALSEHVAGLTERLPLGLVAGDYQFLGEGLTGEFKRFWTPSVSLEAIGDIRDGRRMSNPLLEGKIVFSDGTSGQVYDNVNDLYRTYRGGTAHAASGTRPGGAVMLTGGRVYKDLPYVATPDDQNLKMHGAVLFGVAFLVRNKAETVTDNNYAVSAGDELQMLVMTGMTLGEELDLTGDFTKEFVDLLLQLHPRGIGEGYCAADRYRVAGRPLQKSMRNVSGPESYDAYLGRDTFGPIAPPTDDNC